MANNYRQVKLLIVRHGEREDEAIKNAYWDQQEAKWDTLRSTKGKAYSKMDLNTAVRHKVFQIDPSPKVDSLDPLLTPQGHQQAKASFLAIARALPKDSKVAVFSSPLRRAIGTSLMLGSVPWDESIHWSAPVQAASSNSHSNEDSTTIPVTVLNGLGDFASRVNLCGGAKLLSENGFLRCSNTLSGNDGGHESPFVQAIASMPSHESGEMLDRTNDVRFWTPEGQSLTGAIDPHTKPYRAENADDKLLEIKKQKAYFAQVAKQEREAEKHGLILPSSSPPDPLEAVDEAIRTTLAQGCDTCLIVAHREAIRDIKKLCNHRFRIAFPYCCIGSFRATTTGGRNDKMRYNFWSVVPFQNFGPTSIPQCLSHNTGFVSVMWTQPNGEPTCLCRLDVRNWNCSLPAEVWPKVEPDKSLKLADLTQHIETGVVSASNQKRRIQNFVVSLAQKRDFLFFDSIVEYYDGNESRSEMYRFRFSREKLSGARVKLWYKSLDGSRSSKTRS